MNAGAAAQKKPGDVARRLGRVFTSVCHRTAPRRFRRVPGEARKTDVENLLMNSFEPLWAPNGRVRLIRPALPRHRAFARAFYGTLQVARLSNANEKA